MEYLGIGAPKSMSVNFSSAPSLCLVPLLILSIQLKFCL